MRVTIVYDNTAVRQDLQPDWGFAALIEAEKTPKILFDTGADGRILLGNMKKLNIDAGSIGEVFISHSHLDHTGGLAEFLKFRFSESSGAEAMKPQFNGIKDRVKIYNPDLFFEPTRIHKAVFSTGKLDGIEQSMGVETRKGIVLIVGCAHPKMSHILDAAGRFGKVYGIIGGMHGFSEFELFKDLGLICPAHCTRHKAEIRKLYPQKYIEGGVGRIIEI